MKTRIICKNCNSIDIYKDRCRQCGYQFGTIPVKPEIKKSMKYKIRMDYFGGDIRYREVEGVPFVVPGFEEIKLFSRKDGKRIVITEISTGMTIGESYSSELEANDRVLRSFETVGIESLRQIIAKALKEAEKNGGEDAY